MTRARCLPFVFSLCLHGGVMAGLVLLPEFSPEDREQIHHVSLEEFSLFGASGSAPPGRAADDSSGEQAAPQTPESESGATRNALSGPGAETPASEDAPEKPEPQTAGRSKNRPPFKRTRRTPATPDAASSSSSGGPPSPSAQGGVERTFAVAPERIAGGEGGASSRASGLSGQSAGSGVHDASRVDQKPSILRRVKPEYPAKARNSRVDGTVVVRIVIDTAGLPSECAVHSASPPEYFEEAALDAARRTRFLPGRIKGRPVKTLVLLPFAFRLK
ncbi:MAG: TonB family protein [Desulfovibrio sp.]|jgi:protein TonB|nr:TonB family protein [Desulfovibrio sp.]